MPRKCLYPAPAALCAAQSPPVPKYHPKPTPTTPHSSGKSIHPPRTGLAHSPRKSCANPAAEAHRHPEKSHCPTPGTQQTPTPGTQARQDLIQAFVKGQAHLTRSKQSRTSPAIHPLQARWSFFRSTLPCVLHVIFLVHRRTGLFDLRTMFGRSTCRPNL